MKLDELIEDTHLIIQEVVYRFSPGINKAYLIMDQDHDQGNPKPKSYIAKKAERQVAQ